MKKLNRMHKDTQQTHATGERAKMTMETNKHSNNRKTQLRKEGRRSNQPSHGEA